MIEKLTLWRCSVGELVELGDNAANEGNNDDALRQYYAALEKERHSSAAGASSIQAALILHKIGLTLALTGDSFAAMNSFEEALQIRQEKLGPGSEESAESTAQMLKILDDIRIQSGVGERQYVKGDDGSIRSDDALVKGTNLLEWGEYKEAETVLTKCLKSMNDNDDSQNNNEEKIKVLGRIAELDRAQGKYDAAKEHYLEVLKTVKKMNADSDSEVDMSVINSIAGYAEILRKAGDLLQAEALHGKVRDMLTKCSQGTEGGGVAETDLQLAISHTQLGCTVFALRKYDDALQEHQSALKIRLRILDVTDALCSESFNYCAETLCAMGQEEEALPLSLQAVDIRAREFGTSHPAYAHALCILSKCYHGVGRSKDAMPFIEKCLEICEHVFSENHANIIPNLIVQGDIVQSVGSWENALAIYKRAETIHNANFNTGQKEFQLEEIEQKVKVAEAALKEATVDGTVMSDKLPTRPTHNHNDRICGGTPVIVITDVGRDIDDSLALIILSSLKNMCILNPLAVITTLEHNQERACLARTILDSLSMYDVPIGIGTELTNCPAGDIALHCFDGVTQQQKFQFEPGSMLMARVLKNAEPKSVKILCLANMKDISSLIVKHEDLFRAKIKEVVLMGGAKYSEARQQVMPDETASNNSTDLYAARHLYAECQQNHIPTTTISRYAAYGCPLNISFLDGLQKSNHLLALEVRDANFKAMQILWNKCTMPAWMPGRGKLPARCDREWFIDFFHVQVDDATVTSTEILKSSSFYLYDALAMLCCVDFYLEINFTPKRHMIDGTLHRVIGLKEGGVEASGVNNKDNLIGEINGLMEDAFKVSLEGVYIKPKRETTKEDESIHQENKDATIKNGINGEARNGEVAGENGTDENKKSNAGWIGGSTQMPPNL